MNLAEALGIKGELAVEIFDSRNFLVSRRRYKNLVVDSGINLLRDALAGDYHKGPTHLWLGTNTASPLPADTASTMTSTFKKILTTRIRNNKQVTFQTFIPLTEANGVTYNEAGLVTTFNSIDTLFSRVAIAPIVKTSSVQVTFTWSITLAAA